MTNKFKVGDKVKRVSPDNDHKFWNDPDDGMFHGNVYEVCGFGDGKYLTLVGCKCHYNSDLFELVQPKQFTKSDLKDGMKVVYRNGEVRYVLGNWLLERTKTGSYLGGNELDNYTYSLSANDRFYENLDIMEVYERDGTLLWKREEAPVKTQAQIEYEELQKTIKELQAKADSLGKLL